MNLEVLIRAHTFSAQEAFLADRLEDAFQSQVTFVTDDSAAVVATDRFAKIGITRRRVRELIGGRVLPQWGWQFGDVSYYAARAAFPDATHFALIESDVLLSEVGARRLAKVFAERTEDLLAPRLRRTEEPPSFSKDLIALGRDPQVACFFPITRASTKALEYMQNLRRREREQPRLRINDEAIMANVAFDDGVTFANLSESASDIFDPDSFTLERTQLFEHLAETYEDVAAIHPVRTVAALLNRIETFGVARNFRRRYREAIEQAAPRHRQKLRRALAVADERRAQNKQ